MKQKIREDQAKLREERSKMVRCYLQSRNGEEITYGDLMAMLGTTRFELSRILGRVLEMDKQDGVEDKDLVCSIVVRQDTGVPGVGLVTMLCSLEG